MLLEDEQHVIKWLSQYGALPKTQILQMLYNKPRSTAEKIIRNLKRNMQITDVGGGYYLGLDGLCKPDQRMILAVWVLLKFINVVDPMAHYPATYPAQLFFLKENTGYEIVVLYEGEQHLSKLLHPQDDDTNYPIYRWRRSWYYLRRLVCLRRLSSTGRKSPRYCFTEEVMRNGRHQFVCQNADKTGTAYGQARYGREQYPLYVRC